MVVVVVAFLWNLWHSETRTPASRACATAALPDRARADTPSGRRHAEGPIPAALVIVVIGHTTNNLPSASRRKQPPAPRDIGSTLSSEKSLLSLAKLDDR